MIRKYLSKDNFSKPYVQYNGIMLIRILADNPGKTFTRNFDQKFVDAIKELLRVGRDPSVKQILMETLDTFQRTKTEDEGLALLNTMWKKEHDRMVKIHVRLTLGAQDSMLTIYRAQEDHSHRLPHHRTHKTTFLVPIRTIGFHLLMSCPLESKKHVPPRGYYPKLHNRPLLPRF
jgi:hypothetical protein